jgi:succinylglutamate desuccinylase
MTTIENNLEYFKKYTNLRQSKLENCIEFEGKIPGPTIVFSCGIHGNEPAGVDAAVELHKKLKNKEIEIVQGKVVFILSNPIAYSQNTRFIDSNMNRGFVENIDTNTVEGKRAFEIRNYLAGLSNFEVCIDFHSVNIGEDRMFIYFDFQNHKEIALKISDLDFHFIPNFEFLKGSLMQECISLGAKAFSIECGNNISNNGQTIAYNQMLKVLDFYKMITGLQDVQPPNVIKIYRVIDRVKVGKNFQYLIPAITELPIKKGQEIVQFEEDGKLVKQIVTQDSFLILPDLNPNSNDTDAGFVCTLEFA